MSAIAKDGKLDLLAAYSGCVVLAAALVMAVARGIHVIFVLAILVGVLSTVAYIILRDKLTTGSAAPETGAGWWAILVSFLPFAAALLVYCLRTNPYEKPLAYYVLMSASVGITVLMLVKHSTRGYCYYALALSCLIGLSHIWTETLMFDGLIGIDPWTHMATVTVDVDRLGLPSLLKIGEYPSLWHFYIKWAMDIARMSYRMASLTFVGSPQMVGNVMLAFLVGRKLIGSKAGAVAALLLSCANWNVSFGEWIVPSSIGATYAMATILLLLSWPRNKTWTTLGVASIAVLSLFTHLFAAVWVAGTIVCFITFPIVFNNSMTVGRRLLLVTRNNIATIVLVALAVLWFTANGPMMNTLAAMNNNTLYASFGTAGVAENAAVSVEGSIVRNSLNSPFLVETIINSLGMLLYIGVALLGVLLAMRRGGAYATYAVLSVTVLGISIFPMLAGISVLDDRWRYFTMVLLSVPAACVLLALAQQRARNNILVSAVIFLVVFLNIIGWWSNLTQRALSPNQIVRYALTGKEMEGLSVALSLHPISLGSDSNYLSYARYDARLVCPAIRLDNTLLTGNFTSCEEDVILLRDAVWKEPFAFGSGAIYVLGYNPVESAEEQGYREVWSNDEIHCLVRK